MKKMPKFSFGEALRYFMSGQPILLYLLIYDPKIAGLVVTRLGSVGLIGVSLCSGSLIYVAYRAFIYNKVISLIQDLFRAHTDNYRTFPSRNYKITKAQAVRLYILIRDAYFEKWGQSKEVPAAAIHYAYLAGLLAFPPIVLTIIKGDCWRFWIFLALAIGLLMSAFIFDRRYEDEEFSKLRALDENEINVIAKRLFNSNAIVKDA